MVIGSITEMLIIQLGLLFLYDYFARKIYVSKKFVFLLPRLGNEAARR